LDMYTRGRLLKGFGELGDAAGELTFHRGNLKRSPQS
jgi:hypothetical protein